MGSLVSTNNRRVVSQWEVDTRVRDQISLELRHININRSIKPIDEIIELNQILFLLLSLLSISIKVIHLQLVIFITSVTQW